MPPDLRDLQRNDGGLCKSGERLAMFREKVIFTWRLLYREVGAQTALGGDGKIACPLKK